MHALPLFRFSFFSSPCSSVPRCLSVFLILAWVTNVRQYVQLLQYIEIPPFSTLRALNTSLSLSFTLPKLMACGDKPACHGCFHVRTSERILVFLLLFAFLRALYAERAFSITPRERNVHIRVQYHACQVFVHLESASGIGVFSCRGSVPGCRQNCRRRYNQPVETAYFIRTVVGTIPGTDTTVVCHLVQPFAAVVGCSHRANVFAWRVIAMLASIGWKTTSGFCLSPVK